ncbi:UNVERIFIED_ORG: hypothetical protein ABIB52_000792 [Arthrobacter sp. UYCu721]
MADLQTTAPSKAKAGAAKAAKQQPQRFRVSVPAADEAVLAWMDLQDNPSLSVRMLIRENIERNGYVDVINRPVAQLPKRGRPPGSEDEQVDAADQAGTPSAAAPTQPVRQPAAATTDLDLSQEAPREPELLGIALEDPTLGRTPSQQPAPQQDAAPDSSPIPSEPEQPSSGQIEVNDIFSTLR